MKPHQKGISLISFYVRVVLHCAFSSPHEGNLQGIYGVDRYDYRVDNYNNCHHYDKGRNSPHFHTGLKPFPHNTIDFVSPLTEIVEGRHE